MKRRLSAEDVEAALTNRNRMEAHFKHGEHVTLDCGCTMPPGCKCPERVVAAASVHLRIQLVTGLTSNELLALRREYQARNDAAGLIRRLQALAEARGNKLEFEAP